MQEIWKDIKGYEGKYQVSNLGKIKSMIYSKPTILKAIVDNHGYLRVTLYKNGKKKAGIIHRLVAQAFMPNPNSFPVINHKNGIKSNNSVANLEWCSQSHNVRESYRLGLQTIKSRRVNQYDLSGNLIRTWESINEPRKKYNASHISDCCRGLRKYTHGYIWRYAD